MCCFSGPVQQVSNTRIFARSEADGRQVLVYRMDLSAASAVAMVLPIPVPAGSGEAAVAFADLSAYPGFFTDLARAWPPPQAALGTRAAAAPVPAPAPLVVQSVGDFEASFVPGIADFARLDARFRMPPGTWDRLPQYRGFGFVVFKLKAGVQSVQPMAFRFPRADRTALFFPTVHVHDGLVHPQAMFDHELFLQARPEEGLDLGGYSESALIARQVMRLDHSQGLVDPAAHIHRRTLRGMRDNRDTLVGRA